MRTTLNEKEFAALKLALREHKEKQIANAHELAKIVSQFVPASVGFIISEQDGVYYFEHTYVTFEANGLTFSVHYGEYTKKYSIYCTSISELKNVDRYSEEQAQEGLTEPNKIGVMNAKKLNDWVEYYTAIYNRLKVKDEANGKAKEEFLKSIEGLPVQTFDGGKSGSIVMNGIELEYRIEKTYISKTLKLHYNMSNTVETFKKLADNKFVAAKR